MGSTQKIYFFGQTPIAGVCHIPLQTSNYIDPYCDLSNYDFIIITSKRAIKAMLSFSYDFASIPIYCVGSKTADFALAKGLNVMHVSKGYAKDLISEIKPMIKDKRGLYLRPKTVANSYITDEVEHGTLEQAICYETVCVKDVTTSIEHPAILLFAAPSQIACFRKFFIFDKDDKAIAIGRTTFNLLPTNIQRFISDESTLDSLYAKAQCSF